MTLKTCRKCKQDKHTSDFYSHPTTKDRLQQVCKACGKQGSIAWNAAHPARHLQNSYKAKQTRCAAQAGMPLTYACKINAHFRCKGTYILNGKYGTCQCECHSKKEAAQ